MTENFDDILNYDPLLEAEKATGLSYKEDPGTQALGFLLLQESAERKRDELMLREDTYWGMPYFDAMELALSLGFEVVYSDILRDDKRKHSTGNLVYFNVLWRSGVLLKLESYYGGEERGYTVNSAVIYFNWMTEDGTTPASPVSGTSHWTRTAPGYNGELADDPWVKIMNIDVREGLKHTLEKLGSAGIVPEQWLYTDRLIEFALTSYAERERPIDKLLDKAPYEIEKAARDIRTEARIKLLAEPVRSMMLAGRRGKDWD